MIPEGNPHFEEVQNAGAAQADAMGGGGRPEYHGQGAQPRNTHAQAKANRCGIAGAFVALVQVLDYAKDIQSDKTVWPSGLRRWLKAPVRKGVGSNPTAVNACR